MDPLSSLHFSVSPELRAPRLPKAGEEAVGKPIPFGELDKLTPGYTPQPLAPTQPAQGSFENTLGHLVSEVSGKQATAAEAVTGLLTGQNVGLHQAMVAMEEASISFQLMVEVRNRLLDSYQELMRMQI